MLEIRENTSSIVSIESHLKRVSPFFIPQLSSYVNIGLYAQKIYDKALRIEYWSEENLVGLLAYYLNEPERFAYITNVSVESSYLRQGLAQTMIDMMINNITDKVDFVRLEVNANNIRALGFYSKNGFVEFLNKGDMILMEKRL